MRSLTLPVLVLGWLVPACRWDYEVGEADHLSVQHDGGSAGSLSAANGNGGVGTGGSSANSGGASGSTLGVGGSSDASSVGGVSSGGASSSASGGGTSSGGTSSGGASSGGASSGGASSGNSASGGASNSTTTGGSTTSSGGSSTTTSTSGGGTGSLPTPDVTVTIGDDEGDSNPSPDTPGGNGLSLREAIVYSNDQPGVQVISLGGLTSVLNRDLTTVSAPAIFIGDGGVVDATSESSGSVFYVTANDVQFIGIDMRSGGNPVFFVDGTSGGVIRDSSFTNPGNAIFLQGSAHALSSSRFSGCSSDCVAVYGTGHQVSDSRFTDVASDAVRMSGTALDTRVVGNVVIRSTVGIAVNSGASNTRIYHNTIVSTASYGFAIGGSTGTDIRNNIVALAGAQAVGGNDAALAELNYLLTHQTLGVCSSCSTFPGGDVWDADPDFVDLGADVVSVNPQSPAVDRGLDLGVDRLSGSGEYLGNAPDLGAYEVN